MSVVEGWRDNWPSHGRIAVVTINLATGVSHTVYDTSRNVARLVDEAKATPRKHEEPSRVNTR